IGALSEKSISLSAKRTKSDKVQTAIKPDLPQQARRICRLLSVSSLLCCKHAGPVQHFPATNQNPTKILAKLCPVS
ncbi:MAG: hypothetical protein OXE52_18690, partial [Chloroflexi bacterium]|nr:hypothetical protein [Chloroflexota bacterium]